MHDSIDVVPVASSGFRHPSRSRDSRRASPLGVSPARPRVPRATCDYSPWPPRARAGWEIFPRSVVRTPIKPCTLARARMIKSRPIKFGHTDGDRPTAGPTGRDRASRRERRARGRADERTRGRGGWRARSSVTRSPRSRGRGGARCRRDGRRGAGRAPPVGRPRRRRRADAR